MLAHVRQVAALTAAAGAHHLVLIPPMYRDEKTGAFTESPELTADQWRVYRLPIPPALVGQTRLAIELRAPPFVPAFVDSSSEDLRVLSVRVSDIWIE